MAVAYDTGNASASAATVSVKTVVIPAGAAVGELCLAVFATSRGSVNVITPPSGWTAVPSANVSSGSTSGHTHLQAFYRVLQSGDPGTTTGSFTFTGGSVPVAAIVACYSGVDATTPFDVTAATSATASVGPVTTVTANTRLVYVFAGATGATFAAPSGEASRNTATSTSGASDKTIGLADGAFVGPGSTGSITSTSSGTTIVTLLLALRQSGAVPPNVAPTANAGVDQDVANGANVTLTGSGTDSDGTIASYAWTQVAGTAVTLSGAATSTATFTGPNDVNGATLTFRLTVTDNSGGTGTDDVVVTVAPAPFMYRRESGTWVRRRLFRRVSGAWVWP